MSEAADAEFPGLFCHRTRADWGVSVLSGERDGKRTYLFEGGEERVMGSGAHDMMLKITTLTTEQRNTLARLTALVAGRRGLPASAKTASVVLLDQLTVLRRTFPRGMVDAEWQNEKRAGQARATLVPQAQDLLSLKTLDAQLEAQQFDAVWASASKVLVDTGWVLADQLIPTQAPGVALLAGAVRELLYGSANIEQRVDRFSVAFEAAFRRPPRWEITTGLLTLVSPDSHVLVDLASFRKQLRILGSKGTLPQSPTGPGYVRCVNAARIVASKLTEHGEVPQDLLDVHDFIRFTLKASAPARRPKAPSKKKAPPVVEVETEDADDSE
jgi:hypothetical protein